MFKVCVPEVALNTTVPVPDVNVPELSQLPVKEMVPVVARRVPELVMSPGTVREQEVTSMVQLAGMVRPAAKIGAEKIKTPTRNNINCRDNLKNIEFIVGLLVLLLIAVVNKIQFFTRAIVLRIQCIYYRHIDTIVCDAGKDSMKD